MLQIFRDRDREPLRDLVPWAGEFAGKYLISAVQALRLTQDPALRAHLATFVTDLVATQHESGYLGPFPTQEGMIGEGRWDLWGQYHVLLGLFEWFRETGDRNALNACLKCADHFCAEFLGGEKRVLHAGWEEMNESCSHIFALLYQAFGEPRYLQLLREIERDWEVPPSGDYVRTALEGTPFYKTPKPRWEGLHCVQAIAELYFIRGEEGYRKAFLQIWRSIQEGDRHNTGGFSSGEQATGNPYDPNAIETCCTVAWMAITVDALRMTGDPRAADELELSLYNATLGSQSPSGRWWTYNTPMDGERKASAHDIVFQARAGSGELNCCSVNAPRGIGFLAEWGVMQSAEGLALNYYGEGVWGTTTPQGDRVLIEQETDYPRSGSIALRVLPQDAEGARFTLSLRIPGWSEQTSVLLNGEPVSGVPAGAYLRLERAWSASDRLEIELDMRLRLWSGEREAEGKAAVYWGPMLLAYDPRFDVYAPDALPEIEFAQTPLCLNTEGVPTPRPYLLLRFATQDGGTVTLCDFASAGAGGNLYRSWLPRKDGTPLPYSEGNPLRTVRV
jgi:DUF1680 family protein